ncbi:MAG: T9SS type A sorting domain-containing protein [Candidatus Stygibacter australis]|nr:T9SS type A sorting domain-containing protein [Candidatus Stygibacter australis]MDP8320823.1 T9SS type A sorting domain-containing protein [Candidatus Stygibacter australis]
MKKLFTIIFIVICLALSAQNNPKNVGIYILPSEGVPADGTIIFTASIISEGYTLSVDQTDVGCGYKALASRGLCYVNMASFVHETYDYEWSQGDIINWVVSDNTGREELGNVNQTLATGDGASQYDTDYWGGTFLPVTLSSFTAVYQEGTPVLQWITQSEINNAGWNIYRSDSEEMAESMQVNPELITGAGTTTETQSYFFRDEMEIEPGNTYHYLLENVDYTGSSENYGPISIMIPVDDGGQSPEVPIIYGLYNNYPNPFNPDTKICFVPDQTGKVNLNIFNVKGQKIKTLFSGTIAEAQIGVLQSYFWDGTNEQGRNVSSGIYFYRYESPLKTQTKKMLMIK